MVHLADITRDASSIGEAEVISTQEKLELLPNMILSSNLLRLVSGLSLGRRGGSRFFIKKEVL